MEFQAARRRSWSRSDPGMRVRFVLRDKIARGIRVVPADEADMPAPALSAADR